MAGKDFDQYDVVSTLYGGIRALQEDPYNDAAAASACFIASYDTITTMDHLL